MKKTANSKPTRKRKAPPKAWKPGQSGNLAGAPVRGESWAEIIKKIGDMTPPEAAEMSLMLAKDYLKLGAGITLKQAVVMMVYRSLLHEAQPGLFNALMDRAEGKLADKLEISDWRNRLLELGATAAEADDVFRQAVDIVTPKLLSSPAMIDVPQPAALQQAATDATSLDTQS